jgi:hypothetical protein
MGWSIRGRFILGDVRQDAVHRKGVRRRPFLQVALASLIAACAHREVRAQGDEPRRFRWRVPAPKQALVEETLVFDGTIEPDTDSRGFIVMVAGAALLVYLARAVLRLHDELEGGTVIDVRGDEILIERRADLPGDFIVIVDAEGAKLHQRSDLASPADLAKLMGK